MRPGKIKQVVLNRSIIKYIKKRNLDTISKPYVGLDSNGFIDSKGDGVLTSISTMTGYSYFLPEFVTLRALNNLYASMAKGKGITLSLTIPKHFEETMLKDWTKRIDHICEEHAIDIYGGHTAVNEALTEPVLTVNAIGVKSGLDNNEASEDKEKTILITKNIGMEGTLRIITEKEAELNQRFTNHFIEKGKRLLEQLSLKEEYEALKDTSITYAHDVAEGGVFAALWELSEALKCGLEVDLRKIPMTQETIEFCECYDINPYMLVSGGSLLIVTEEPKEIINRLSNRNIEVTEIGTINQSPDKIIRNEDEIRYLEPYRRDEIYKIK